MYLVSYPPSTPLRAAETHKRKSRPTECETGLSDSKGSLPLLSIPSSREGCVLCVLLDDLSSFLSRGTTDDEDA